MIDSLWDLLPPEMEEHVLKYVKFVNSPMQQNKELHHIIHKYKKTKHNDRYDIDASWPFPKWGRLYENSDGSIRFKKDIYGCIRCYRCVFYYNGFEIVRYLNNNGVIYSLDITQAKLPSCYNK